MMIDYQTAADSCARCILGPPGRKQCATHSVKLRNIWSASRRGAHNEVARAGVPDRQSDANDDGVGVDLYLLQRFSIIFPRLLGHEG